jgi:hypothetical protein
VKLGRDKLKSTTTEKDEIEEQLGSDKLNVADGELKLIKMIVFGSLRKVDGSRFFWSIFDEICQKRAL